MGISGWDAVPGDAQRGFIGELARAIALAAVPADGPTVSDDGTAMEQHRRRDPSSRVSARHSRPPRSTCTWG
jgi:hypothetical protein